MRKMKQTVHKVSDSTFHKYILLKTSLWCRRYSISHTFTVDIHCETEACVLRLDYLISIDYSTDVTFHYYCHHSTIFSIRSCSNLSFLIAWAYLTLDRKSDDDVEIFLVVFFSFILVVRISSNTTVHFMVFGFLTLSMHRVRWMLNTAYHE